MTRKQIIITVAVIILWLVGYVYATADVETEPNRPITKDEFVKLASDQFSAKYDKIKKEEQEAIEQAKKDSEDRLLRAITNVSVSTGTISTGFTIQGQAE